MASRLARTPRIASFASQAALLSLLAGCGGAVQHPSARVAHEGNAPPASLAVSDDAFPEAVRALLASSPGSSERQARLAGVEARQMQRAVDRFKNKEPLRGLAAVVGGLELIHKGELNPSILGPSAAEALRGAARELSARGDEGRAQAVFEIWSRIASPADKAEIQTHLDALALWMKDAVGRGGPMQSAGALENAAWPGVSSSRAIRRSRRRPTGRATGFDRAFALRAASDKSHKAPPSREDVGEALRALQTGAIVLAAIYLRDVDAKGALAAIDKAQAQDLAPDGLLEALKVAAARPSADSWLAVLQRDATASRRAGGRERRRRGDCPRRDVRHRDRGVPARPDGD